MDLILLGPLFNISISKRRALHANIALVNYPYSKKGLLSSSQSQTGTFITKKESHSVEIQCFLGKKVLYFFLVQYKGSQGSFIARNKKVIIGCRTIFFYSFISCDIKNSIQRILSQFNNFHNQDIFSIVLSD